MMPARTVGGRCSPGLVASASCVALLAAELLPASMHELEQSAAAGCGLKRTSRIVAAAGSTEGCQASTNRCGGSHATTSAQECSVPSWAKSTTLPPTCSSKRTPVALCSAIEWDAIRAAMRVESALFGLGLSFCFGLPQPEHPGEFVGADPAARTRCGPNPKSTSVQIPGTSTELRAAPPTQRTSTVG